jgi:hypothetical protein
VAFLAPSRLMRSAMGILWLGYMSAISFSGSRNTAPRDMVVQGLAKASRSGFRWFGPSLGMLALKLVHHDLEQRELLFLEFGISESDLG